MLADVFFYRKTPIGGRAVEGYIIAKKIRRAADTQVGLQVIRWGLIHAQFAVITVIDKSIATGADGVTWAEKSPKGTVEQGRGVGAWLKG